MIATIILLAGLAGGGLAGPSGGAPSLTVAYDPGACENVKASEDAAPADDVGAMVRRFVDILEIAGSGEQEAALRQAAEAGNAVAAFRDPRAIERLFEISKRILNSHGDGQLGQVFGKMLRASMDPTAYPKRISDTRRIRFLKTVLDHPISVGSRSAIDTRLYLEYRLDAARICESRKIFLNIAIADGYRFRADDNPDFYFAALEKRVDRLAGLDVDGQPLKWLGFLQLTKVAMRYGDFNSAWRFLKRTEAEAQIARATMDLNSDALDSLEVAMEWLGPYFLQERMEYACPDEHYIGRVPCVLREHH